VSTEIEGTAATAAPPQKFTALSRIFHWLTAILIFAALFIGFTMVNWLGCPPDVPQLEDIEFIPCAGRLADRRVPFAAAQ